MIWLCVAIDPGEMSAYCGQSASVCSVGPCPLMSATSFASGELLTAS
jgi:hypothetical protein